MGLYVDSSHQHAEAPLLSSSLHSRLSGGGERRDEAEAGGPGPGGGGGGPLHLPRRQLEVLQLPRRLHLCPQLVRGTRRRIIGSQMICLIHFIKNSELGMKSFIVKLIVITI